VDFFCRLHCYATRQQSECFVQWFTRFARWFTTGCSMLKALSKMAHSLLVDLLRVHTSVTSCYVAQTYSALSVSPRGCSERYFGRRARNRNSFLMPVKALSLSIQSWINLKCHLISPFIRKISQISLKKILMSMWTTKPAFTVR